MDSEDLKPDATEAPPKKAPKPKKRPSDFEIFRTILTRTHERKLPFLLKDMGEDPDILFMCSAEEEGFTYGSPDLSIMIIEISDPELKTVFDTYLGKLHGYHSESGIPRFINVRDQVSELAKTKGESIDASLHSNPAGSVWVVKQDVAGKERTVYFSKAVESLFHVRLVESWCKTFRPLLSDNNPEFLYYPYVNAMAQTSQLITLPPLESHSHPLRALYPKGLRFMVTKGIDVLLDKFPIELPDPVMSQDLIAFRDDGDAAIRVCHRMVAEGWRMLVIRPNMILFPTLATYVTPLGHHSL